MSRNLTIESLPSSREQKWTDRDKILLHASFQILKDFVEKEKPDEYINWESDSKHSTAWKEICFLYNWWVFIRPNRVDPMDSLKSDDIPKFEFEEEKENNLTFYVLKPYNKKKYRKFAIASKKSSKLEYKWQKEDIDNLVKLAKISPYMWT